MPTDALHERETDADPGTAESTGLVTKGKYSKPERNSRTLPVVAVDVPIEICAMVLIKMYPVEVEYAAGKSTGSLTMKDGEV